MRWSIKSLLARIGSRNSETLVADQNKDLTETTQLEDTSSDVSTDYESAMDNEGVFISDQDEEMDLDPTSLDIIIKLSQNSQEPTERHLRFSVDFNQNYSQDQVINEFIRRLPRRNKIAIKSILKSPTKGRKNTAKRKALDQVSWQEAGFSWKEKATPREQDFMKYMWEMINDQQQEQEDENDQTEQQHRKDLALRLYDLDTYEIITPPPSVLDLTLYDDAVDEFGVFFNERFIVTNYLMEGSPCGLCEPNIATGVRLFRKPVQKYIRTATVLDSYQLSWNSPDEFTGEYLEDAEEEARYKALQKQIVEGSNTKDYGTNPLLEEFKNGTWRLTIFEESEEATSVDVRKQYTSDEIQKLFGLSDAGSIILNVDHIDVVQGKCGFNRGKATKRFLVPLGQEATDRSRMRDIRRKWNSLFNCYTFAFGSLFGEDRFCGSH